MSASRIRRDERRARTARVRDVLRPKLPPVLRDAWENACYVWSTFCWLFETPAAMADREAFAIADYKERRGWIRNLERLVRTLVLVAAFALNLVLRPAPRRERMCTPRQPRLKLAWPDRPETWRASLRLMPIGPDTAASSYPRFAPRDTRSVESLPLARRLEAVRRVLANPDAHIRRLAVKLARIAQANARANAPRKFALRIWDEYEPRRTPGDRMIAPSMREVHPIACCEISRWNEAADPG